MYIVTAAIEALRKLDKKYESLKRQKKYDEIYGLPDMADPIFYDEKSHLEIKDAIKILSGEINDVAIAKANE